MTANENRALRAVMRSAIAVALFAAFIAGPAFADDRALAPSTSPSQPWSPPPSILQRQETAAKNLSVPASGTVSLSLANLVDLALKNNPSTRSAWFSAQAAAARLGSEKSAYYPTVDVNAQAVRSKPATLDGSFTSNIGASAVLDMLLLDFGGRRADVEQARQALIAADWMHNAAIQDVLLTLERVYFSYLSQQALLDAEAASLKEAEANLAAAEERRRAGVATIADVLQARTALAQAKFDYETINGNLETIRGSLATVLGLPTATQFDVSQLPSIATPESVEVTSEQVESLIARAEAARPDLAATRALADRARARIESVRAEGLPKLSLTSSAGRSQLWTANGNGAGSGFNAGIFVRFPLFTGFRNSYDIREARALAELAGEQVRSDEQAIGFEVWSSFFATKTARQRLIASRELLASATQSEEVAAARYREGVGTIIELLSAQAALADARAREIEARTDWFVTVATLAHATGTLDAPAAISIAAPAGSEGEK